MLKKIAANRFLKSLEKIEKGSIRVTSPEGTLYEFHGQTAGAAAHIQLHDWQVPARLAMKGNVAFAEDYAHGLWESHDLEQLSVFGLQNKEILKSYILGNGVGRIGDFFSYLGRRNSLDGSRKNIPAHYDLGNEFYKLWLDPGMTYSSALFAEGDTLDQAQDRKYDRMIDGLGSLSGSVLEIGCGWGGFADRALDRGDYTIKGITLSHEQKSWAENRLGGKTAAAVKLEDYRHQEGQYDHIVSIEMFEAVGMEYWHTYFSKVADLLKKGGRAMIQTITIKDDDFHEYKNATDFIRSHIFPGGMLPSLENFKHYAHKSGLKVTDVFGFGHDYAHTLRHWLNNFDAKKDAVQAMGFDENFMRMWRFYLAGCAAGFATGQTDVMQIRLAHAD